MMALVAPQAPAEDIVQSMNRFVLPDPMVGSKCVDHSGLYKGSHDQGEVEIMQFGCNQIAILPLDLREKIQARAAKMPTPDNGDFRWRYAFEDDQDEKMIYLYERSQQIYRLKTKLKIGEDGVLNFRAKVFSDWSDVYNPAVDPQEIEISYTFIKRF